MPRLTKAQRQDKVMEMLGAILHGDDARAEQLDKELGGKYAAQKKAKANRRRTK